MINVNQKRTQQKVKVKKLKQKQYIARQCYNRIFLKNIEQSILRYYVDLYIIIHYKLALKC